MPLCRTSSIAISCDSAFIRSTFADITSASAQGNRPYFPPYAMLDLLLRRLAPRTPLLRRRIIPVDKGLLPGKQTPPTSASNLKIWVRLLCPTGKAGCNDGIVLAPSCLADQVTNSKLQ
uniref:Uncharacterized protein n=1 Tax=Leersia perrieri TaxID=77586 RepID=A0A0D9XR61_9ORYZ